MDAIPSFVKDPTFQFFVIASLMIIIYLIQRKKKSLSYSIISSVPLLNIKDEMREKIKVLYENLEVNNLELVIIRIENTGNVPITTNDYEKPLTLRFGKLSSVISAEMIDTEPSDLVIHFDDFWEEEITLSPVLLNKKDSMTIKLLVSDFDGEINVHGRIIGVKEITKIKEKNNLKFISVFKSISLFILFWMAYHLVSMHAYDLVQDMVRNMDDKTFIKSVIENRTLQFFVLASLVFLAIVARIIYQRKKKSLAYKILSSVSLLNIKHKIREKIKVLYENSEVNKLELVIIRIENTGNVPIIPKDYEQPITVHFGKLASVISAEVIETEPKDLEVPVEISDSKIVLNPSVLLNKKDSMTIKLLVNDFDGEISNREINVHGRITDVKKITVLERDSSYIFDITILALFFLFTTWLTFDDPIDILFIIIPLSVTLLIKPIRERVFRFVGRVLKFRGEYG